MFHPLSSHRPEGDQNGSGLRLRQVHGRPGHIGIKRFCRRH
jgi:hypothetical protein